MFSAAYMDIWKEAGYCCRGGHLEEDMLLLGRTPRMGALAFGGHLQRGQSFAGGHLEEGKLAAEGYLEEAGCF